MAAQVVDTTEQMDVPDETKSCESNDITKETVNTLENHVAKSSKKKKRFFVDPDESPEMFGRRQSMRSKRNSVLQFIIASHIRLTAKLAPASETLYTNMHLSHQVTNIFTTIHNSLKHAAIGSRKLKTYKLSYTVHVGSKEGQKCTYSELKTLIKAMALTFGLNYDKPLKDGSNYWYGKVTQFISCFNLFEVRMNELRIGHGSTKTIKIDGESIDVSQYGLHEAHYALLEGISLPFEKMPGMVHTLGPMTTWVALSLCENDSKYSRNWKLFISDWFTFLPNSGSLVTAIHGKPANQVKKLFTIIADILLITTSRKNKRASFPVCMLYKALTTLEFEHWKIASTVFKGELSNLDWFSFSGNGLYRMYGRCTTDEWQYPIIESKAELLPEIIFHSIMGTFSEDFGMLKHFTERENWKTRNEMDEAFENMGIQEPQLFKLISIVRCLNMTFNRDFDLYSMRLPRSIQPSCVFSGYRTHVFTDDFLEYLRDSSANSIDSLTIVLQKTKTWLLERTRSHNKRIQGTISWHQFDKSTDTEWGPIDTMIPRTIQKCFMQTKE